MTAFDSIELRLWETQRSADAAEKSADASQQSAEAAQKSTDLAIQQFAEQRGLAPRIVRDLIDEAYLLAGNWMGVAANIVAPPSGS